MPTVLPKIGNTSHTCKQKVVNNIVLAFLMTITSSTVISQEMNFQLIGSIKGIDTGTIKLNTWLSALQKRLSPAKKKKGKICLKRQN